ncbi:hypothetical protein [Burkholderia cepacia]|uniref:hypothetical protein n=1 Tax=Burkholderia cepacia TaxID=292 RepID=UPI0011D2BEB4|nr:hypothetical protein [Burkholderia cepacia]
MFGVAAVEPDQPDDPDPIIGSFVCDHRAQQQAACERRNAMLGDLLGRVFAAGLEVARLLPIVKSSRNCS